MCWAADDTQLKKTLGGDDPTKSDDPLSPPDSSPAKTAPQPAENKTAHEAIKPSKKK